MKVLPLRRPREEALGGMMLGASEVRLDLQGPIDDLRLLKSDLEAYYWERPDDGELQERQRYQMRLWMRQVGERTAALEDILMHMGTPTVVVSVASTAEAETLRDAVTVFGRWVREGEPFDDVLRSVAVVLSTADMLWLRAAGGRPDGGV